MKSMAEMITAEREERQCEEHGDYTASMLALAGRKIWTNCPMCDKERRKEEDRLQTAKLQKERQERLIQGALKQAAIPPRFLGRTLDSYQPELPGQKSALALSQTYAETFPQAMENGRSLIFCGAPGTGKTHLAAGIAQAIIQNGYTAAFTTVMNAIRRIRDTYGSKETERDAIKALAKPDLLILDEVGLQRGTDDEKVLLFDIINERYEQMRPMILISNLTIEGIKTFLGERAVDRLKEGGGRAMQFTWESYRK